MQLVTAPTAEPLTLDEAKAQCRVDGSHDDMYLTALIVAAREHVETVTRMALMTQTWSQFLDCWPCEIQIHKWPIQAIESVTYRDADEADHTLASTEYIVATGSRPGRIVPKYGKWWPSVLLSPSDPITVRGVFGYASAADIPQTIKAAMLLLVGSLYEHREQVIVGAGLAVAQLPLGIDQLLATHRSYRL